MQNLLTKPNPVLINSNFPKLRKFCLSQNLGIKLLGTNKVWQKFRSSELILICSLWRYLSCSHLRLLSLGWIFWPCLCDYLRAVQKPSVRARETQREMENYLVEIVLLLCYTSPHINFEVSWLGMSLEKEAKARKKVEGKQKRKQCCRCLSL